MVYGYRTGKKKQAITTELSMPEDDPSGVRDKIFNEISLVDLNTDNGVKTLIKFMNILSNMMK